MPRDLAVLSRRTGRWLSGGFALLLLGWAFQAAGAESMPVYHVYDGFWMLGGAALGLALAAGVGRRWRRERALVLVALLTAAGAWAPIALLALRAGIPVWARFKGAWVLAGGDVVALAAPVAAVLGWLALREHRPAPPDQTSS